MVGKILLQLSTGVFKEVNIKDAFGTKGNRRTRETMPESRLLSRPHYYKCRESRQLKKFCTSRKNDHGEQRIQLGRTYSSYCHCRYFNDNSNI